MAGIVMVWLTFGAGFLAMGAWPVFGFLGLDVLLIYLAFRWNYRSGRVREEIEVSRVRLDIRKYAPSGRMETHQFNPFWTRFAVARHEEIGITDMAVEGEGAPGGDRRLPQSGRPRELSRPPSAGPWQPPRPARARENRRPIRRPGSSAGPRSARRRRHASSNFAKLSTNMPTSLAAWRS